MSYTDALAYLESLGTFGIQLGLRRIEALLERLDHPERRFRCVHVTGTNGKGSTTAFFASILAEAGLRTGMYISPHLVDYPERMRINGVEITQEAFADIVARVREAAKQMTTDGIESPTEFEVLTASAFLWFACEQAEIVVVEVGLGGLLDSTNVILPEVSVITNVTLEHTDRCGDTVEAIAHHKAGIIKPGAPVVTGASGAALAVIEAAAANNGVQCFVLNRDFFVSDPIYKEGWQNIRFTVAESTTMEFSMRLLGRHQAENAAFAIQAAQVLGKSDRRLTGAAIQAGVAQAKWPGRFEVFAGSPAIILDGAHNPDGIRTLRRTLDEVYPGQPVVFLFGVLADKKHDEMVQLLFHKSDRAVVVRPNSERAAAAAEISREIEATGAVATTAENIASGLLQAKKLAGCGGIVCVAGSLYMIGEARQLLTS